MIFSIDSEKAFSKNLKFFLDKNTQQASKRRQHSHPDKIHPQ